MIVSRKLWTGALVAAAMTIGSVASAAFVDDWSVAFNEVWIGVQSGVAQGDGGAGTDGPFTAFNSGVGYFDADRTATLTFLDTYDAGSASLTVDTSVNALQYVQAGLPPAGMPANIHLLYEFGSYNMAAEWSAFEFSVNTDNGSDPFVVDFVVHSGGASTSSFVTVPGTGGMTDFQLSFSTFGNLAVFESVDQIEISFSAPALGGLDISLTQLAVVPVPPAAGLILLGMVGVSLRRKFMK
jgi:hypothetical protein